MKTTIQISALAFVFGLMSFTSLPIKNDNLISVVKAPVTYKSEAINLGNIPQNQPMSIDFEFTNTSEKAVVITNVRASCGCTATDYTKTPIQPGETAKITAVYNAAAKGPFSKNVTVTTNAEETPKVLTFSGTVI